MTDYTFFIDDGGGEVEVFPAISDIRFADERDEQFGFVRRTLETPMVFVGTDYALIYSYEVSGCQELDFIVKFQGSAVFSGLLRVGTPNVNVDNVDCQITARIDNNDAYACLLDSWGEEFNMLSGTSKISINTLLGTTEQETCMVSGTDFGALQGPGAPSACLSAPAGAWSLLTWSIEESGTPGFYNSEATWIREVVTWPCSGGSPEAPAGSGWELVTDNCGTTSDAVWARAPDVVPVSYINDSVNEILELVNELAGGGEVEMSNAVLVSEIMDEFMPCGLTVVSNFLNINPSGASPANDEYDSAAINLQYLAVFQKSDVRLPSAAQDATIGRMSMMQLLTWLNFQFDMEFRISGTEMRLEHSTYFTASPGLDLSASPYAELVAPHLRYGYASAELARSERWSFMENTSADFAGQPIQYLSCVPAGSQPEIPYNLDRVNNDVSFIVNNPDLVSDDGFVFVNAIFDGAAYYFSSEQVVGAIPVSLNGHMAIPNLLDNYHRNRRLLLDGVLNGVAVTFNSAIPRKAQEEFSIILSRATYHSSFDAGEEITTVMGGAEVARALYDGADCSLTLNLKYQ